jgi:hypothetical protein
MRVAAGALACAAIVWGGCGENAPAPVATPSDTPAAAGTKIAPQAQDFDRPEISMTYAGASVPATNAGFTCMSEAGNIQADAFTDQPQDYFSVPAGAAVAIEVSSDSPVRITSASEHAGDGGAPREIAGTPAEPPLDFAAAATAGRYRIIVFAENDECSVAGWLGLEVLP